MASDTEAIFTGETAPEPMPSSNESVEQEQEAAPEEEVSEAPELELPEDAKARTTEQFEKLKYQLAEERQRRLEAEEFLSNQQRQGRSVGREELDPLYDPVTGYVNVDQLEKLRKDAREADKRASMTQEKFEKYVQEQQEAEAYSAYPELNPKNKDFDQTLFNVTRALITDSMINPKDYGGKELTAKQAAQLAKREQDKVAKVIKEEAAKETVEKLTEKEQASLEATGSPANKEPESREDLRQLQRRSRKGDLGAIMERLKGIPPV